MQLCKTVFYDINLKLKSYVHLNRSSQKSAIRTCGAVKIFAILGMPGREIIYFI